MSSHRPQAGLLVAILLTAIVGIAAQPASVVIVDRDNVAITASCTVQLANGAIADVDDNGVIHITSSGIVVDFGGLMLRGAAPNTPPDQYQGVGVRITGKDVTIRNLRVSGFKVGVLASDADRLTIEDADVSDNFRQRLRSTPQREDAGDWLWPHANDNREWVTNYGAGLCVENSTMVTIRRVRARHVQNGIILDRVERSLIYDNDCSFLSGWGLAMWRSSSNQITRNAFDFCIRGYSHGVYNRGQDSAGLLMFEQCSDNIIAENSMTHGGDGIFAFSGKEALGDVPEEAKNERNWYRSRGHRRNIIIANDCSYAAAHGIELTFGFDNSLLANRLVNNAICGVWGGYSHRTIIAGNVIESNGEMAYGLERGGVNIEHGVGNWVQANAFANNACGVHLWWDEDPGLAALPWAKVNNTEATRNVIYGNTFTGDALAIHLRMTQLAFIIGNTFTNVARELEADESSMTGIKREFKDQPALVWAAPEYHAIGSSRPVGARAALAGREKIIMTEWGPYDWSEPMLKFTGRVDHADEYVLLGGAALPSAEHIEVDGNVEVEVDTNRLRVRPMSSDVIQPYSIALPMDGARIAASGTLTGGTWDVRVFPSTCDPREDADRWRREGRSSSNLHRVSVDELDLNYAHGGLTEIMNLPTPLPRDHFGTIARRTLSIPPGTWRVRTTSDDGIRVWMNEHLVIDDWTWHAPKEHIHEFDLKELTKFDILVEHFELDGFAVLQLAIERVAHE